MKKSSRAVRKSKKRSGLVQTNERFKTYKTTFMDRKPV